MVLLLLIVVFVYVLVLLAITALARTFGFTHELAFKRVAEPLLFACCSLRMCTGRGLLATGIVKVNLLGTDESLRSRGQGLRFKA